MKKLSWPHTIIIALLLCIIGLQWHENRSSIQARTALISLPVLYTVDDYFKKIEEHFFRPLYFNNVSTPLTEDETKRTQRQLKDAIDAGITTMETATRNLQKLLQEKNAYNTEIAGCLDIMLDKYELISKDQISPNIEDPYPIARKEFKLAKANLALTIRYCEAQLGN